MVGKEQAPSQVQKDFLEKFRVYLQDRKNLSDEAQQQYVKGTGDAKKNPAVTEMLNAFRKYLDEQNVPEPPYKQLVKGMYRLAGGDTIPPDPP